MPVVNTYWYKGRDYPNLGDEMTPLLLERLFGVQASLRNSKVAELISTGSILGWIRRDQLETSGRTKPQHVVGSGFMYADDVIIAKDNLAIHSVRGHLTKQKLTWLSMHEVAIGDPGLLAPRFARLGSAVRSTGKIGLIPHHSKAEDSSFLEKFAHLSPTILDIRTTDIDSFLTELTSCELVISQSLHGLIFADSVGIPNIWFRLHGREGRGDFKYLDYFSSVGRDFREAINTPPANIRQARNLAVVADQESVRGAQRAILSSYEAALDDIAKGR